MTEQDQVGVLTARVEALEVELETLRRALLSLGSGLLAGGAPGPQGYMAWHDHQLNPPPQMEQVQSASGPVESPSGSTGGLDYNPISAATQSGSSQTVSSQLSEDASSGSLPKPPTFTGAPAGK